MNYDAMSECLGLIIPIFIPWHKHGLEPSIFFPLSISLKDSLLHKTKLHRVSHIHNYDLFLQQTKESSSTDMLQEKKKEYDIMKGNEHPIF